MKITPDQTVRLEFLARVAQKECMHLAQTDQHLFAAPMAVDSLQAVVADPLRAESLDAFVARFGRLQDTLGDKFIPALLGAAGEAVGPAIDNLDKAEKFGWLASADQWMEMRRLRNQMVHEYIEDLTLLCSALNSGHAYVGELLATAQRCAEETRRLLK